MTRLTLNRIAIKGISQHKTPFIAKLPHANRGATDEKRHFRALFQLLSTTNFSTKNHDKRIAGQFPVPEDVALHDPHCSYTSCNSLISYICVFFEVRFGCSMDFLFPTTVSTFAVFRIRIEGTCDNLHERKFFVVLTLAPSVSFAYLCIVLLRDCRHRVGGANQRLDLF